MKKLNDEILAIKPSQTLAISSLAKQMVEEGHRVCNFSAGEPDFDTPDLIKQAAIKALLEGKTNYTPVAGVLKLRQVLADKFNRVNKLTYDPSQIIISCGGKHALALIFQTLLNPGDEVLIPVPFWLSYPEMVRVAGGQPVFIHTTADQGFKITPQHIECLVGPETKALVVNSPGNPTGVMYTPDELYALGETALKHDITLISDEIYEEMVYDGQQQVSIASFSQTFYNNTITVNGFSKTYAMTGWRLGYTAGPAPFIKAMTALQSHCASAPNTFAQWGAIAAVEEGGDSVRDMISAFDTRRQRITALMAEIPRVNYVKPTGAFYIFPDISAFGLDSVTFAKRLLEQEHVAVVPGVAFGADTCVRLSYACGMAEIKEGITRLARFCSTL